MQQRLVLSNYWSHQQKTLTVLHKHNAKNYSQRFKTDYSMPFIISIFSAGSKGSLKSSECHLERYMINYLHSIWYGIMLHSSMRYSMRESASSLCPNYLLPWKSGFHSRVQVVKATLKEINCIIATSCSAKKGENLISADPHSPPCHNMSHIGDTHCPQTVWHNIWTATYWALQTTFAK